MPACKKPLSHILLLAAITVAAALIQAEEVAAEGGCGDCFPRVVLKSNLLHDAMLTPDLGLEVGLARRFSMSLSGVYAWWSNDSRHRYWRIRGGVCELRFWPGERPLERALTGHHIGIYGSMHDFDFEFGGKGWQSPQATYGIGVGYGYSLRLSSRLNLDLGIRLGLTSGNLIKYKPMCGEYISTSRIRRQAFGISGAEVTLVWFVGKGQRNNPDFSL